MRPFGVEGLVDRRGIAMYRAIMDSTKLITIEPVVLSVDVP